MHSRPLRSRHLGVCLSASLLVVSGLLPSLSAVAAQIDPMVQLSEEQGVVRLQLSVPVGAIEQSQLSKSGSQLILILKDRDREQWSEIAKHLGQSGQGVKSAKLVEQQGRLLMLVDLKTPMKVVDETMVMGAGGKRVQWEVVMMAAPKEVAPVVEAKPTFLSVSDISVVSNNGLNQLTIRGDKALVAELSFPEKTNGLMLSFPGANEQQLVSVVAASSTLQSFANARVGKDAQGTPYIVLEAAKAFDVIDAQAKVVEGQSVTNIDLVSDMPVQANMKPVSKISVDDKTGQLQVFGAETAVVQTFLLDQPKRLMVDLLGVAPDKVEAAVAQFKANQQEIKSIRFGDTRLGSTRLEVTPSEALASRMSVTGLSQTSGETLSLVTLQSEPVAPSALAQTETKPAAESKEGLSTGAVVAGAAVAVIAAPVAAVAAVVAGLSGSEEAKTEKKPEAAASVAAAPVEIAPVSGLDLRYRPKFDFTQQPRVAIKPVSLSGKAYDPDAQLPAMASGKGYALMSLFDAATTQDSAYQVAKAEYLANIESQPQARAGYLPQASFDFSYSNTRQSVNRSGSIAPGGYEYPYNNWALTITQPIFRMQNLIKMDQADVAVEQAKLALLAAEQDLIMRVSNAYLGVLAAKDALELVKAEREATEKQYELAEVRFKNGLGTVTQLSESKGRVALVRAREIDAEYKLSDARLSMKQIVGDEIADVTTFKEDFSPAMTVPNAPEPWIKAALEQNLALQTRRMAIDIANFEVKRQNAAYMPTVDAVASAGQRDTERTLYSASREQVDTNYDVTLKLRMPLYDGGMTPSLVREATARLDKAKQEHQQEYRQTEKLVRSAFMGVKTTTEMLTALRESVKAQELTLNSKLEGYKAGVDSVVSVLDSYRSYYSSRRDYLQARYDYLVNRLKLKQSVGTLSREDLAELADLLH